MLELKRSWLRSTFLQEHLTIDGCASQRRGEKDAGTLKDQQRRHRGPDAFFVTRKDKRAMWPLDLGDKTHES